MSGRVPARRRCGAHLSPMRQPNRFSLLATAIYALMLVGAVLAFLWIRQLGTSLQAPPPPRGPELHGAGASAGAAAPGATAGGSAAAGSAVGGSVPGGNAPGVPPAAAAP